MAARTGALFGAVVRCAAFCLCVALFVAAAGAQEQLVVEGPEPATIRLGEAAVVRIKVEGKQADPRAPELPQVDGLSMRLSPPARSSYRMFDGRRLIERVGVQYVLELQPMRAGTFVVPPFTIWTGTQNQRTRELNVEAREDFEGAELGWVDVEIEPQRVYVHEPVRVRVDFGVEQGIRLQQDVHNRYRYLDIEVQARWLDEFPGGERLDLPQLTGDTRLTVANQRLNQVRYEGDYERDGKVWQHFSFERAFLPTRLGTIELPAPLLRFHVVRRAGSRDVFNQARGRMSENLYAYGEPLQLEVLPIPEEGRPTPYYGAVGRFSIGARLDRNSVRVGESVKLTVTVRGRGNLEFLRLPALDDLPGFHKLGAVEPQRDADKVVVTYDLTPLSADVTQVPPVAWNFFDTTPGIEQFVEVETAALPLHVEALPDGESLPSLPSERVDAVVPGVDDIFDLPELGGEPVRARAAPGWLRWTAVVLPWLLVGLAFAGVRYVRRSRADVTGQRVRGAKRAFDRALADGAEPLDALTTYLGDRLDVPAAAVISPELQQRLLQSGLDEAHARDVAAAIERGTAARYGGGAGLGRDEAVALVQRLEPKRFGARLLPCWLPLLLAVAAGATQVRAQQPVAPADPAAAAVQAYREGDYAAADRDFALAYERTGDRRLLRARGNCLFRLGRLAEARWAYESARLGLPRDQELRANLRLVRQRLELPDEMAGFDAEVEQALDSMTAPELVWLCCGCMLLAAGCLVFGWRRLPLRWLGFVALAPATLLAVWLIALEPARPLGAIAVERLELTAEPREDLEAVATVRPGVQVQLGGRAEGDYVLVLAGSRRGYAPRSKVRIIR